MLYNKNKKISRETSEDLNTNNTPINSKQILSP